MHSKPATGTPQKTKRKSRGEKEHDVSIENMVKTHIRYSASANLEITELNESCTHED